MAVREPPDRFTDVDVDANNKVLSNRKGLSVVDDWRRLPAHLIPEHLDDGFNGARGKDMRVFVHGSGDFEEAVVANGLYLFHKPGSTVAGVIAPPVSVELQQFQRDLAATRPHWVIDES
ncbi:MAG TPA: hypothetical protein PK867_16045 [Pirellulales bacterium]|nr:hypothetical protein [Pirellulales bacterium]